MPEATLAGQAGAKDASEVQPKAGKKADYDSEALMTRATEDVRRTLQFYGGWKSEAREDYQFAVGQQWTPEEESILTEQGRPVLTINKIGVQLDVIAGYERNNSARIRVSPEGSEDKVFSDVGDKAVNYMDKTGLLDFKLSQQFDDGMTVGRGLIELSISYEKDPLHGDLRFSNEGPYSVLFDPDSKEYDRSDAEFSVKIKRYTKSRLKAIFPKKADQIEELVPGAGDNLVDLDNMILEGDADNYGQRATPGSAPTQATAGAETEIERRGKITVLEYWYRRYVPKWYLFDIESGRMTRFDKEEEATARIKELEDIYKTPNPQTQQPVDQVTLDLVRKMKPQKRVVAEMWVFAFTHGLELSHGVSPLEPRYSGFPFFEFLSYWKPSAASEVQRVQGLVRRLKDPQREVNKARSQYLHVLNTQANSGWIIDEDSMSPKKKQELEEFGSKAGIVIEKKAGSTVDRIEPAPPQMAQILREKTSTDNMKETTGLNADLLSVEDSKNVSGRALALRIKQALTIVAPVFENWRMTKRLIGEAVFKLIPEVMDAKKLERVVGQGFMQANNLAPGQLGAILVQIEDGRYDVSITEATNSETIRQETFEQLLEIGERSGTPIPPDLLLEFSNVPNATEAAKRIQDYQQTAQAQAQAAAAGTPGGGSAAAPPGAA